MYSQLISAFLCLTDMKQVDDPEAIQILQNLHSLSFCILNRDPIQSRGIISNVLSLDQNVEVLLAFMEKTGTLQSHNLAFVGELTSHFDHAYSSRIIDFRVLHGSPSFNNQFVDSDIIIVFSPFFSWLHFFFSN